VPLPSLLRRQVNQSRLGVPQQPLTLSCPLQPPHRMSLPHIHTPLANLQTTAQVQCSNSGCMPSRVHILHQPGNTTCLFKQGSIHKRRDLETGDAMAKQHDSTPCRWVHKAKSNGMINPAADSTSTLLTAGWGCRQLRTMTAPHPQIPGRVWRQGTGGPGTCEHLTPTGRWPRR